MFSWLRIGSWSDSPLWKRWRQWQTNLYECLPDPVRGWLAQRRVRLVVEVAPSYTTEDWRAELWRQWGGERQLIGVLDPLAPLNFATLAPPPRHGWHEIRLVLPKSLLLLRTVRLPLAVKDHVRRTLTYEMDRLTPFQASALYFDARIVGVVGGQLEVELAACRRDLVQPWLIRLKERQHPATRVTWSQAWSEANLLSPAERPPQQWRWLPAVAMSLLLVILLAAVLMTPIWQLRQEHQQLRRTLRVARHAAEEVPTLREELERARMGSVAVLEHKAAQPRMTDLLLELTERLPDDTWVQTINYRGEEVDIRGMSVAATELIGHLEPVPEMSQVTFRSPVMQVSQIGKERFHIVFVYKPVDEY